MNPVDAVTAAVAELEAALPGLLEACTDPQALDMAELFATIQDARHALYGVEKDAEHALARAMTSDQAISGNLRVERKRASDRKEWAHDDWKRDVRQQALRSRGLLGAHVFNAVGEELDAGVLHELLAAVQSVHGSAAPKSGRDGATSGGLRAFGLSLADYCTTTPGPLTVTVTRLADEPTEVKTDAA